MEETTAVEVNEELTEAFEHENHVKNDTDSVSVWCTLKELATLSDILNKHGMTVRYMGRSAFEGDVYVIAS